MGNGIMQSLTDAVVVILLHRIREQSSSWQLAHGQIADFTKNLIHCQYEWSREMLVINNIFFCIA